MAEFFPRGGEKVRKRHNRLIDSLRPSANMEIIINSDDEQRLKKELENKHAAESERIKRYLSMPDLSRTEGSPIKEIVDRILAYPYFKELDIIQVPEIVPADISFDMFDFPSNHPARSRSDTYYVDDKNILR